jgi:hypothetical protein
MRWWLLALSIPAWACDPAVREFPCKADEAHFSIVVDSVQTTLSRDDVKVSVEQLPSHQSASIQNLTDKPLYSIGEKPPRASESTTPYFIRDKKKWFLEGRYTNAKTSCVPADEAKGHVQDPGKTKWNCEEQEQSCGGIYNTNILYLPPGQYPLEWAANGLVKGKITPPKVTEQKFTQYFLHQNKVEKVSLISTVSMNDEYLKVTCDENAKISSCGQDCELFENLSVAIKNPSSAKFPIKTEEHDFSELYEIELFVDQDFKSRLVDAGGILVKYSIDALNEIQPYGDLRQRPLDYVIYKLASKANDDLIPVLGQGWKFSLRQLPLQKRRVPAASRRKSAQSK